MTTTILLDSDIVAFQFSSTAQQSFNFGDTGVCQSVEELSDVTPKVHDWITSLMEKLHADEIIVCLSVPSEEGWRKQVLPSYKGNRKDLVRPILLQQVKDYLATEYPSYIRPTLEADDVMGVLSTHPTIVKGTKIIVSEDKDMKTIPGLLFNPRKHNKPQYIPEPLADFYHMYQTLTGDTTDGYKGCPGMGPVKTERLLNDTERSDWWSAVVSAFKAKGLTEEDALVQARVARICRAEDYDFKNKEVKLWNPR
jgi:DNA polymerase-1